MDIIDTLHEIHNNKTEIAMLFGKNSGVQRMSPIVTRPVVYPAGHEAFAVQRLLQVVVGAPPAPVQPAKAKTEDSAPEPVWSSSDAIAKFVLETAAKAGIAGVSTARDVSIWLQDPSSKPTLLIAVGKALTKEDRWPKTYDGLSDALANIDKIDKDPVQVITSIW